MTNVGPISVVSAGAGTGKTWRLSTEYVDAARSGTSAARIIATTFTIKAANELIERVRARLIREGFSEAAQSALAGLVGTVNGVCGRLVADFAIDGGLSPVTDVIPPEMANSLFGLATEEAIQEFALKIDPIADRFGQGEWRSSVLEIVNLARASGLQPQQFAEFARRSREGIEPLLVPVTAGETAEDMQGALFEAIQKCIAQIEAGGDTTKTTAGVLDTLRQAASKMSSGMMPPWSLWAKLSKLKAAQTSDAFLQPVRAIAARHPAHPGLHTDLSNYIELVFASAAAALQQFSDFKRDRGLLDFIDQEALALNLLRQPEVRDRISEQFDLLMVDEFQDTSPIQLAVFLELAKTVKRSLWVGDQKQAIFGFRQSEPGLVNAVIEKIRPATGGQEESLDTSRRSRPELVRFANAVFGAAFPSKGVPVDKVVIPNVLRAEPTGFGGALEHWKLDGKNWPIALAALAGRIQTMLAAPTAMPVINRADGVSRPLRSSDIAVLCRQNDRCKAVADTLSLLGIPAAMPRGGLLETPEAVVAVAALRYLVDRSDTLAIAELAHFSDGNDDWLNIWLSNGADALRARCAAVVGLDEQRADLARLTPAEALDAAIAGARIDQLVRRWERAGERLANLDALRKVAVVYEDACRAGRAAATAGGLVAYLAKGLEDGGEQPAFEGEDAVRVLTYHRAKGLEWPVVILVDLDAGPKHRPFGVFSEAPSDGMDPWNPLAGRWIRFWPWPYAEQAKDVHLDATAAASPLARARAEAELSELVRLLYVGVTRARDYLVFCTRTPPGPAWLDLLTHVDGSPVLTLPTTDGEAQLNVGEESFTMMVHSATPPPPATVQNEPASIAWYAPPSLVGAAPQFPSARLSPSGGTDVGEKGPAPAAELPIVIGQRLPLTGSPDMRLVGEAVHGFLAADRNTRTSDVREAMARGALERWGVGGALQPTSLLEASGALDRFIADRWPQARRHREVPVFSRIGDQRSSGRIDLLLEINEGFVIIDHKTFPGSPDKWSEKALEFAPQLALYSRMVAQATGRPVLRCFIHMPIVGAMIELVAR